MKEVEKFDRRDVFAAAAIMSLLQGRHWTSLSENEEICIIRKAIRLADKMHAELNAKLKNDE